MHLRQFSSQNSLRRAFTLGGLILVEGIPFGLTAEHAFQSDAEVSDFQNANEEHFGSSPDLLCYDESSESPFISFDDESDSDISQDPASSLPEDALLTDVRATSLELEDQTAHSGQSSDLEGLLAYRRIGSALPSIRRDGLAIHHGSDWALIQINNPSYFLPNEIELPGSSLSTIIEDVVPENFENEGHVLLLLASGGARHGWLMPSPVVLKVGNTVMDTRLIISDSKLGEPSYNVFEDRY